MSFVLEDLVSGFVLRDIVDGLLCPSIVPVRLKLEGLPCFKPAFLLSKCVAYFLLFSLLSA